MPTLDEPAHSISAPGAINLQRAIENGCSTILALLLFWKGVLPGWHVLNSDFPNYYLVARLLREGYSLDRIYDWIWLQRIKDHWGLHQTLVGFAGLTPFSALPVVPFSAFSALTAKRLWILTNLLLLGSSVEFLSRVTSLGCRRIWLLTLLAVLPLRTSFLLGQMHIVVLFLLVLAYYFHRKGWPTGCGVCLAIAGVLKVYPLLFVLYFLWKRQWRSTIATLSAALVLVYIGYLWIGSDAINIYATQILPRSLQGEALDPYNAHIASGAVLFHKLFIFEPALNPLPLINSPLLYSVLYPLWQLALILPMLAALGNQTHNVDSEKIEWATYLFTLLVLSPVPSSYHFVMMIFSMVLLMDVLKARRKYGVAILALALYCLISVVQYLPGTGNPAFSFVTLLAFARLWVELLLWAVLLFCLWPDRAKQKALNADSLRTVSLCWVAVVGWTVSAFGYHQHFLHLQQEMKRRMPALSGAYLSRDARPTAQGYAFTAMLADGYRVLDQEGHSLWPVSEGHSPVDQLSFAVAANRADFRLELADGTGSRIVAKTPPSLPDAESPAISLDGKSVAFLRERKGKGTLWIATLGRPPVQVGNNAYDVRDVTFAPSGCLFFAAKADGRLSIWTMIPGGQPRLFLSSREDVDSPAVSPDEQFVAFRKLLHNRWQLGYMRIATREERMLTFGDCNVYSPGWTNAVKVSYASDCGRGLGLSALSSVDIDQAPVSFSNATIDKLHE